MPVFTKFQRQRLLSEMTSDSWQSARGGAVIIAGRDFVTIELSNLQGFGGGDVDEVAQAVKAAVTTHRKALAQVRGHTVTIELRSPHYRPEPTAHPRD